MDKTGEGNVMLDLTLSAQKCPKTVMQVKEIHVQISTVLLKITAYFLWRFGVFFSHLKMKKTDL